MLEIIGGLVLVCWLAGAAALILMAKSDNREISWKTVRRYLAWPYVAVKDFFVRFMDSL